jgi:hypothetical protein
MSSLLRLARAAARPMPGRPSRSAIAATGTTPGSTKVNSPEKGRSPCHAWAAARMSSMCREPATR